MAKKSHLPVILLAFANEKEAGERYLNWLPQEMAAIRKALHVAEDAGLCEVEVIPNATLESILNVFQRKRFKDRIAVLHYGGHADGYQLLLETASGSSEIAHGEGLVSFFSKQESLQLIFLNGCSTQQQAIDLTTAGVPMVIGTSESISDEVATKLAIRFYSSLANGASIGSAWQEAQDEIKIRKGSGNTRALRRKKYQGPIDHLPWEMLIKKGAEMALDWNLPDEAANPLFGLPDIPSSFHLPEQPFHFLERYMRKDAPIFFGRSHYIREVFNRVMDKNSAPVLLFYGQSGVGKSSLLESGLLPRLEQVCYVVYVRRSREYGLLGTLKQALGNPRIMDQMEMQDIPN